MTTLPIEVAPPRKGVELSRRYRAVTTAAVTAPIAFASASGCWLTDVDGNRFLDFIGGYGVVNTGWQHPEVVEAVARQAGRACFSPPWFPCEEATELAEQLLRVMQAPAGWKCIRATGGADANEHVLKAISLRARLRGEPGRTKVLRLDRSYQGGTAATLALSDVERFSLPQAPHAVMQPMIPAPHCAECPWGMTYGSCDFECLGAVARQLAEDPRIAAVLLEPVLGSGGVIVPPPEYLVGLRRLCDGRGVLRVLDEVLTGCGRVGAMLEAHRVGVQPDAITLGKGLSGGGAPIGAALVCPELAEAIRSAEDCSSTFAWTPLACAAASANLRVVERERLCWKATETGRLLREGLKAIFGGSPVRSVGLMAGIDLSGGASAVRRLALLCKREGLIIGTSWDWRTVVLLPPLILSLEELDCGIGMLARAASKLKLA